VGIVVFLGALTGGIFLWLDLKVNPLPTSGTTTSLPNPVPEPPNSTDILLLGSDKNPVNAGDDSRSDTIMLVHVDKEHNYLGILSLPRDLYVDIPGHGKGKLNSAYADGGWELTKQTVERLANVQIERCLQIDFQAFKAVTDAVGGVYLDVDHRYYQDNPQWELAKLSPGYQKLDGSNALDWVRFRHDLNMDFGRMERQQRFLTAIREQAMGWNLVGQLPGVVNGLLSNISTYKLGATDLVSLAYWGVKLDGTRIKQVSLIGDIQNVSTASGTQSVVISAEGAVAKAVEQLLAPPVSSTNGTGETTSSDSSSSSPTSTTAIDRSDFTTNLDAIPNSQLWKKYAAAAGFQLMAPGWLPAGYNYVDKNPAQPGAYDIDIGGGKTKPAMKMVYQLTRSGGAEKTDQYMGIMETTWTDAPAASNGKQVQYNGVTYTVVGTSQNTDHVWWVKNGVLYWVSNTLSYYLNWKDLLKVAESMMVIPSGVAN
jgi:polyisoprenyl-teichoic acid--peptidoglycan teichoic acid transferase